MIVKNILIIDNLSGNIFVNNPLQLKFIIF
jgi:hypothetical protein